MTCSVSVQRDSNGVREEKGRGEGEQGQGRVERGQGRESWQKAAPHDLFGFVKLTESPKRNSYVLIPQAHL